MNVLNTWIQGNQAEHYIQYLLSKYCFVRPVVGNTDIGIDLYCESIIENQPYLHFFIQVKSSETITNEKEVQSFSFKVEHLKYWQKQPVPVLIFLVPNILKTKNIKYIHVIDITKQLMKIDIEETQGTQTMKSEIELAIDLLNEDTRDRDLSHIIKGHIPWLYSALCLRNGSVTPVPKTNNADPINYYALEFLSKYSPAVLNSIKEFASFSMTAYDDTRIKELFKQFSQSVETLITGLQKQ
jgi:hypothetical protein